LDRETNIDQNFSEARRKSVCQFSAQKFKRQAQYIISMELL